MAAVAVRTARPLSYGFGANEITCWYVGRFVVGNVSSIRLGMKLVLP
jgi:hypothetical protein